MYPGYREAAWANQQSVISIRKAAFLFRLAVDPNLLVPHPSTAKPFHIAYIAGFHVAPGRQWAFGIQLTLEHQYSFLDRRFQCLQCFAFELVPLRHFTVADRKK